MAMLRTPATYFRRLAETGKNLPSAVPGSSVSLPAAAREIPPSNLIRMDWALAGAVGEFPLQQARVAMVRQVRPRGRTAASPFYILRQGPLDFLILDMRTRVGCDYRIVSSRLYVRQNLPARPV